MSCYECNSNVGLGSLLRAHALALHERIAELEAELAERKWSAEATGIAQLIARAEKAEAEIERLHEHLREFHGCDIHYVQEAAGRKDGSRPQKASP